jgi:hypothetical protein
MKQMFTTIKRGLSLLFKLTLALLVIAIVYPTLWLAWRVHQPMELDAFGGHTYLELNAWMREEYARRAVETNWHGLGKDCYSIHVVMDELVIPSFEFAMTVMALDPQFFHRELFVQQWELEQGMWAPDNITLAEFMPAFWSASERFLWYSQFDFHFHSPSLGCRLSRTRFDAWVRGETAAP